MINVGGLRIASRLKDETREKLGFGDEDLSNILKVTFGVTSTIKKDPNSAELQIYNLNEDSRTALQKRGQQTTIEAGYVSNRSIIFGGVLEYSTSVYNGTDWITTLQTSDGTDNIKSKRINKSLKGPAKVGDVLRVAAEAMGLKPGDLKTAIARGSVRGNLSEFTNGIVLSGKADKVLDSVAKSMGYFYSIQNGQLMLLAPGDSNGSTATVISQETGMAGSPEPGDDGFVNVRTLIQPNLLPAYRVKVESRSANGFFRIERVDYSGDTWGDDWHADLECSPLGGSQ